MEQVKVIAKPIIKIKNLELINFSILFVVLAVALPLVAHQFHLAGQIFLPMHLFVFAAALLFGWRAGLMVGILTPSISYLTSGMPLLSVLPQITIEIVTYGLVAGLCREKLKFNLYISLIIAMVAGRLASGFSALLIGTAVSPLNQIWQVIKIGWPGILIQLALVPLIVILIKRFLEKNRSDGKQDLPSTR